MRIWFGEQIDLSGFYERAIGLRTHKNRRPFNEKLRNSPSRTAESSPNQRNTALEQSR